ncbi:hypothetical protein ACFE04_031028 [Oxalis oulophora]
MDDDDDSSFPGDLIDIGDDNEHFDFDSETASDSKPRFQFRSVSLKARWVEKMRMAELVEAKGSLWRTTGISFNGKTYLFIEETMTSSSQAAGDHRFLAQIGALHLLDDSDSCLSKDEIYEKIAQKRNGSCWEHFEAYSHLKYLGYIVKRHGVPWSFKTPKVTNGNDGNDESISVQGTPEESGSANESENKNFLIDMFNNMQLGEVRPVFDVYLPSSKFRKTASGDPSFIICFTSGAPPSKTVIALIEKRCGNTPLKFCHVDHGRVSFFSFNTVQLPALP